jgi:tRNA nucleotidyltransferase (CCA-adding enzyme)
MKIPKEVSEIISKLQQAHFEAYIVGGCVRDLLIEKEPKDWDITTQAKPEEVQKIFPSSIYENQFGTVAVKTESPNPNLGIIEITSFRKEGKYTDKRHPDSITFAKTLEDDLSRRDFTINALAAKLENTGQEIIDPFNGQKDLKDKLIRAVGNPDQRFQEDALRLMRAVRFACGLDFNIEQSTLTSIKANSKLLRFIAKERIREEFLKIISTPEAARGLKLLQETGLLQEFLPELEKTIGVTQNKHHLYTVWEHLWRSLEYASKQGYSIEVKLASLFHDLGKPDTKQGEGKDATFYNHEIVSTKITRQILTRLKFPRDQANKILLLVRYHGFVYDPEITTDAAIRRLLVKIGKENVQALAQVREADRIGSGCPKAVPFRLRHFLFRIEKITKQLEGQEPSLKMLKVNGNDIIKILNITPSPLVGVILNILLEDILDDPSKNTTEYLTQRTKDLGKLSEKDLDKLNTKAKEKYKHLLLENEQKIKQKYYVD